MNPDPAHERRFRCDLRRQGRQLLLQFQSRTIGMCPTAAATGDGRCTIRWRESRPRFRLDFFEELAEVLALAQWIEVFLLLQLPDFVRILKESAAARP